MLKGCTSVSRHIKTTRRDSRDLHIQPKEPNIMNIMKLNNITGRLTCYVLLVSITFAQVLAAEVCNLAADSEDIEFSELTLW